jgi:plasmid maintenance system antidote protein VapI
MSRMHNPAHPGEVLKDGVFSDTGLTVTEFLQANYDLWQARQKPRPKIEPLAAA